MMTIESLKDAGANVEEGLSRCLGKEDFYLKMVRMGLSSQNFGLLGESLKEKDYGRAFELCHSLKGVVGNLSLTPLYDLICALTEKLRSGGGEDCVEIFGRITEMQKRYLSL